MKTKDEYLTLIRETLDEANVDNNLSREDYIALCSDVSTEAQDRVDAAESEDEEEEEEEDEE